MEKRHSGLWDVQHLKRSPSRSRREAREAVLQILYAHSFTQRNVLTISDEILLPFTNENIQFIRKLTSRIAERGLELDGLIGAKADHWDLERISVVDRLILKIALIEFLEFEDIPAKVTINEAIEIAKRFGGERSKQFVNGMVDGLRKQLENEGKLKKTGRGLL